MTNKKSLFLRVSALIFATLFAFLMVFMPFMFNKKNNSVYADTISSHNSFTGSSLFFPVTCWDMNMTNAQHINVWAELSFNFSDERSMANNYDYYFNIPFYARFTDFYGNPYEIYGGLSSTTNGGFTTFDDWFQPSFKFRVRDLTNNTTMTIGRFDSWLYVDSYFDFAPKSVNIYCLYFGGAFQFRFDFLDSNGYSLKFGLYDDFSAGFNSSAFTDYVTADFPSRTYYFDDGSLSDSSYYQQGLSDGYNSGYSAGSNSGYHEGYDDGYSVGERSGFNQGVLSANDYTFLGLFGAMVDAPLQAFTGLFDFNLSFDGVHNFNLKGFFLAILSIAIVIAIIRFALRK